MDINSPAGVKMFLKAAKAYARKHTKTKEAALASLVSMGIATKSENLRSTIGKCAPPYIKFCPRLSWVGREIGDRLLNGEQPRPSQNDYDWLGPGVYFWESNPLRGLNFAQETSQRTTSKIRDPTVLGAVIDLGMCLDLTTAGAIELVKGAYVDLLQHLKKAGLKPPRNSPDRLSRALDCAVLTYLHDANGDRLPLDTVKAIFTEGGPAYPGAGFQEKTHVQIAVCNFSCIKGFFRVSKEQMQAFSL